MSCLKFGDPKSKQLDLLGSKACKRMSSNHVNSWLYKTTTIGIELAHIPARVFLASPYIKKTYPWTPTTHGKMQVLHPKLWVITPKNEGFTCLKIQQLPKALPPATPVRRPLPSVTSVTLPSAAWSYIQVSNEQNPLPVVYMGVSKHRGTPKWMVYNGKPY